MNPRQGIETPTQSVVSSVPFFSCRKTVNPRQGIETLPRRITNTGRRILCRKTVNPRQGIETFVERVREGLRAGSEDSESSSGD